MKGESTRTVLITGGAGFIGSNLAERLLSTTDANVRIFDNLSRRGVENNLEWMRSLPGRERLEVLCADVRDAGAVRHAVRDVSEIYHLAAQVAVTTSLDDPASDFDVNARGTFNVLEAARLSGLRPMVLFTSTNKVYGSLDRIPVQVDGTHYRACDAMFTGVDEGEALDFHSPYGCSKGAADQYVRDYARIYDLPTVVVRMSCIAGPRQFGNEDQGWVAHFLYSLLRGTPITIYGDGYQVRDVLHVHDLIDAIEAIRDTLDCVQGEIYNLGGGVSRAVSVMEMITHIEQITGRVPRLRYCEVRPGDQPLYISDTSKLERQTGWHPSRSVLQTLEDIQSFWFSNQNAIESQMRSSLIGRAQDLQMMVAREVA